MSFPDWVDGIAYRSLSSSSKYGNCYLIASGSTRILVDYGVPLRKMEGFLGEAGCDPKSISAILMTHEHGDHSRGLHIKNPFHRRYGIEVYATGGTWEGISKPPDNLTHRLIRPGSLIDIDGLEISAMPKLHDAREPIALLIRGNSSSLGIATDLGEFTPEMADFLRGADHYIIESNYDPDLELASPRPRSLIARVMGPRGHLSNYQAAEAMSLLVTADTSSVLLAHLSLECNRPALAIKTMTRALANTEFAGFVAAAPAGVPGEIMGDTAMRTSSETGNATENFRL
ncbi:MAG: MBL fold metallo-hydrolase, partial [Clostridia bacterium]